MTNRQLVQNGTMQAHGRTWPLYERLAYVLSPSGYLDFGLAGEWRSEQEREKRERAIRLSLERYINKLLEPFGCKVTIEPRMLVEMSPEDRAEANALDEAAISG